MSTGLGRNPSLGALLCHLEPHTSAIWASVFPSRLEGVPLGQWFPNLAVPHLRPAGAGAEGPGPRNLCFQQARGDGYSWCSALCTFMDHPGWNSRGVSQLRWREVHIYRGKGISKAREPERPLGKRWEHGLWGGAGGCRW